MAWKNVSPLKFDCCRNAWTTNRYGVLLFEWLSLQYQHICINLEYSFVHSRFNPLRIMLLPYPFVVICLVIQQLFISTMLDTIFNLYYTLHKYLGCLYDWRSVRFWQNTCILFVYFLSRVTFCAACVWVCFIAFDMRCWHRKVESKKKKERQTEIGATVNDELNDNSKMKNCYANSRKKSTIVVCCANTNFLIA